MYINHLTHKSDLLPRCLLPDQSEKSALHHYFNCRLQTFPFGSVQNFTHFQIESLQTTISNLIKMAESSPKRLKKYCGVKGEIARYLQFLLFSSVFKTCIADT